jgi:ATP/maltotriose-dependent transcriptional regulator MalT
MGPLVALGHMLHDHGQLDAARRYHARALSIGELALGRLDGALVPSLTGLARVALSEGDVDAAQTHAERAVRLAEDEDVGPRWAADAHFVRARALRASGDTSDRARSLAAQALQEHALGHDEERRAEVERWLAEPSSSTLDDPGTGER